jgi:hypothetical protein
LLDTWAEVGAYSTEFIYFMYKCMSPLSSLPQLSFPPLLLPLNLLYLCSALPPRPPCLVPIATLKFSSLFALPLYFLFPSQSPSCFLSLFFPCPFSSLLLTSSFPLLTRRKLSYAGSR